MNSTLTLPDGYRAWFSIDLQRDKKLALLVNGRALAVAVPLILIGHCFVPVGMLFDLSGGIRAYLMRFAVLLGGYVLYIVLHELVHGVCMKGYSGTRVHYGFTGLYAYAGSDAYFGKISYLIIALAPVVVWGVVLGVLCCAVDPLWFWVVYFIQIGNLSGAAGDYYVAARFAKLPADILVRDTGVSMTVYGRTQD